MSAFRVTPSFCVPFSQLCAAGLPSVQSLHGCAGSSQCPPYSHTQAHSPPYPTLPVPNPKP